MSNGPGGDKPGFKPGYTPGFTWGRQPFTLNWQPMATARPAAPPPRPQPSAGSEPAELARIGDFVRARLKNVPRIEQPAGVDVDIFLLRDFVPPAERAVLIAIIDHDVSPSEVVGGDKSRALRSSETCELPIYEPVVIAIERRLQNLVGLPLTHSESPQGQRYRPGQHFGLHMDYFPADNPHTASLLQQGGQRSWTAMIYLNAPEAGGQTRFPRAGIEVAPAPGAVLVWNNAAPDGTPNTLADHEGVKVERGSKYVLTKWFRERHWAGWGKIDPMTIGDPPPAG